MNIGKLNPFNSLFGRVFVWFWTALLVILLSAFFLTKQLSTVVEVNAVSEKKALEAQDAMRRLQQVIDNNNSLNQSLRRLGRFKGLQIVAIDNESKQIRLSFPPPLSGNINKLKGFMESDSPLLIQLNNMEFVGPFDLKYRKSEQKVFVGRLLLRSESQVMSRSKVAIAGLVLAIFLSTLFCFGLVLSITKPLGSLRLASNRLAKGDLSTRIVGLENRKDEVGNLADDFNTMATRLQSLIDNQKLLMANVSHELRTPLTRLQLAVALLEDELQTQDGEAESSSRTKQLTRIENEIIKMDRMIGQVLTLAKINTSQQRVEMQTVTMASIFKSVLQDASFEAEAMKKTLTVNKIPDLNLSADVSLLSSAVENIIRNAIRFSSTQVSCQFSISQDEPGGMYVEICISDDGAGMSASDLETVFDPFYRGTHQVHEVSKGAGLGLSIAKAAIELHGGSIRASTPQSEESSKLSSEEQSPLSGLSVIIRLPIMAQTT
ncbi:MAG: two-component system sensor histidine kinase CpxA [Glaciecola sp.]|jgi:two-component system sensor histidine kinase CpxA